MVANKEQEGGSATDHEILLITLHDLFNNVPLTVLVCYS